MGHPSTPSTFECLPTDVAVKILDYLSIRSISALSQTSKAFLNLCRCDSLWIIIARKLVSPWIHRPVLAPATSSSQSNGCSPSQDWTFAFRPSPCPSLSEDLTSHPKDGRSIRDQTKVTSPWYLFATRVLLPHLKYLGWHASDRRSLGRLMLVTFDPITCELVIDEVVALNVFDADHYTRGLSAPTLAVLPSQRPPHPLHVVHLSRRMDSYRVPFDDPTPHAGYDMDLFQPVYVSLPYFRLRLPSALEGASPLALQAALPLEFVPDLVPWPLSFSSGPSPPRTFPSFDVIDSVRNPSAVLDIPLAVTEPPHADWSPSCSLPSFRLGIVRPSALPLMPTPTPAHPRIRWQSHQPRPFSASSPSVNVVQNGRRYDLASSTSTDDEERFFPISGPATTPSVLPSNKSGWHALEGLWVGYYGQHHGCEFGHLHVRDSDADGKRKEISFAKLTGDRNVPGGVVSWRTWVETSAATVGKFQGQGHVANVNYTYPAWIDTWVSFGEIESKTTDTIKVTWIDLNHVSTFHRVRFSTSS